MFADDTNLFLSHQNINTLFKIFNKELKKIGDWFKANKLFLNNRKTKYTLFHKKSFKDNLPLKLPALKIADKNIERKTAIKFLGAMLDENKSWEEHICTVETKLAKNIGLLYRAKSLLEEKSLKSIYFAYIHLYLNYANIAWASIYRTKLKTIHFHQKHAVSIVFNEDHVNITQRLKRLKRLKRLTKLTSTNIQRLCINLTRIRRH